MNREVRSYPWHCLSFYCGRLECDGCRLKPELDRFKAWVQRTAAKVQDPVWCPNVYTATRGER